MTMNGDFSFKFVKNSPLGGAMIRSDYYKINRRAGKKKISVSYTITNKSEVQLRIKNII